jgi:3-oxoacyl-[acyl-carrier protein] reductase/(S)-1-phenylethanol dehydrogenase
MSSGITDTVRGTAVVTGAARGLGQHFAVALAEAGHDVAILDLDDASATCELIETTGRRCLTVCGDASDPQDVHSFVAAVRNELPPARVLVNNAGISPYASFVDTDFALWQRVSRVNLDSMYLMTHGLVKDICATGHGRIVNLTSSVVWDAQARNMTAYTMTKSAIVGFTRALAGELGAQGVTVNCIAPGIVLTPDIEDRVAESQLEIYRNRQAIPHITAPEDLISTLLYLVDERTRMVTGATLPVNAGRVIV